MVDYVQDHLTGCGFEVYRVPDKSGQKAGIFARLGPSDRAGVLLSGHTDVVPVAGQDWTKPPFALTVEDGRAYGRGATDMKGYLASVMALAERAADTDLKEPLKIAFSYDEEIGCVGIRSMIDHLAPTIGLPRAVFVGEPTSMQVATGHKGKAAFRATCHGTAGHSALAPRFMNALHLAVDFTTALRGMQGELAQGGMRDDAYSVPFSTIHVGKLSGGTALNIVPDIAVLDFELRHLATEDPKEIQARILSVAQAIGEAQQMQFPAARIDVELRNSYPGLETDMADEIVQFANRLAQTTETTKVAFGTEAGYFAKMGIPTIVCGPGSMDEQGHKPDESIALSQLAACDKMLGRLLAGLAR